MINVFKKGGAVLERSILVGTLVMAIAAPAAWGADALPMQKLSLNEPSSSPSCREPSPTKALMISTLTPIGWGGVGFALATLNPMTSLPSGIGALMVYSSGAGLGAGYLYAGDPQKAMNFGLGGLLAPWIGATIGTILAVLLVGIAPSNERDNQIVRYSIGASTLLSTLGFGAYTLMDLDRETRTRAEAASSAKSDN